MKYENTGVVKNQIVNFENKQTSSSIQTAQVIFRNIHAYSYTYTFIHKITINEKRGHKFESKERHLKGFEGRKEKNII